MAGTLVDDGHRVAVRQMQREAEPGGAAADNQDIMSVFSGHTLSRVLTQVCYAQSCRFHPVYSVSCHIAPMLDLARVSRNRQ